MADDKGRIMWFEEHVMHVDLDHKLGREWTILFIEVVIERLRKRAGTAQSVMFLGNMVGTLQGKLKRYQFPGKLDDLDECHIRETEKGDVVAEQAT